MKKDLSKRDKRRQEEDKVIKERVNILSKNIFVIKFKSIKEKRRILFL